MKLQLNESSSVRITIAAMVSALLLPACATVAAEGGEKNRKGLVDEYVRSLNDCDPAALEAILHPNHEGFSIRGGIGEGMNANALRVQCEAGFALDIQSTKVEWFSAVTDSVQVAGVEMRGTLTHPERGTNMNNLRATIVARRAERERLEIIHSHISALQ